MKIIIGLVGSGKTTLYRKLNESKELYAVEIELPQSCLNDEEVKVKLFTLFYYNPNIDCIIAHPYYLPNDFWQRGNPLPKIIRKVIRVCNNIINISIIVEKRK